jgi:plastocyanin
VRLFSFQPDTLRVAAGTRVVWANGDEIEHTVTSGTPGQADGRFALRLAGVGDSAAVVLDRPGTYAYYCERHPSMRGALVVTRTGANTP